MCGIAGIISAKPEAIKAGLQRASDCLHHRGPDGHGQFINSDVGLAHTRLSIIDLAGGAQPLHAANQRLHLIANGEIYNYIELARGYTQPALTGSDCEAILQVYQQQGLDGFSKLHGMYAFALYDEQTQKLILGRDRIGIKPLYYAKTSQGLVFGSEIKAVLALLPKQPAIKPNALSQFLNYQFSTGRDTIFEGVHRVLAGEILSVGTDGHISAKRYWSPETSPCTTMSQPEAIAAFEPLFDQVMREHIRTDVPFGLFLSGGIDSSVLLAKLSEMHSQPINTYSIGFAGTKMADELDAATALAKQFGTRHTPLRVDKDALFGAIVRSIWAADDLMRDYASLPTLLLSEAAANDVKVVFSGEGGDEAFAGYRRYKPSLENRLKALLLGSGGIKSRGQWQRGAGKGLLRQPLSAQQPRNYYQELWAKQPEHFSFMQKYQCVDIDTALADNLLVKADRMMMSAGLEGRVPFADHRIMAFGIGLPDTLKYHNNRGKALIRNWISNQLPADHLNKPKRGFYVPVNEWLSGSFLDQLEQKLRSSSAISQWFNTGKLASLFARQRQKSDASREIFGLMQFAIWHGLFIDRNGRTPTIAENPLDWIA